MAECTHCEGTGRCQDDFHSGNMLIGGRDHAGQDHPGMIGAMIGSCPRCGDSNTEWRPECTHCEGSGQDGTEYMPFGPNKKLYLGGESVKERKYREGQEVVSAELVGESGSGFWDGLTERAATIGAIIGGLCGLLAAVESASSVGGYALYIILGILAGAFLGSAFMTMLPWMAGAAILALLLKACMS